jgi:hypothetical protein
MQHRRASGVFAGLGARAHEKLPDDFSHIIAEIESVSQTAQARRIWLLALLARAAHGRRAGEIGCVKLCAEALRLSRRAFEPYALVARCWTEEELSVLLARRDKRGRCLTASHLLVLAPLPRALRAQWTEFSLIQGLSVRELRQGLRCAALLRQPKPGDGRPAAKIA